MAGLSSSLDMLDLEASSHALLLHEAKAELYICCGNLAAADSLEEHAGLGA